MNFRRGAKFFGAGEGMCDHLTDCCVPSWAFSICDMREILNYTMVEICSHTSVALGRPFPPWEAASILASKLHSQVVSNQTLLELDDPSRQVVQMLAW